MDLVKLVKRLSVVLYSHSGIDVDAHKVGNDEHEQNEHGDENA